MTKISPQKANTLEKIMGLKRDSLYESDYSIVVQSDRVQLIQEDRSEISIPKEVFDAFVKFYVTPQ